MKFTKHVTEDGTELYMIHSKRFTHTCVDFNLYSRSGQPNAANAIANAVLFEGTLHFPTSQAISVAAQKEFGATLMPTVGSVGDLQATGFYLDVLTKQKLVREQDTLALVKIVERLKGLVS